MGFNHIQGSEALNNTSAPQGCSLQTAPTAGMGAGPYMSSTEETVKPPVPRGQPEGQPGVTPFP